MSRYPRFTGRRVAIVAGGALAAGAVFAGTAFAQTDAELAAETSPKVAGTPCTSAAAACVDVAARKAWLIKDGKVFRGPVTIAAGGPGEATPSGDVFRVYRKDKDHKSDEFKMPNGQPAPMPYSVFFEDGGIAFHSGDPRRASAGCVHLGVADAVAFFNFLQIGDHVQVKNGGPEPTAGNATSGDDNQGDNSGDGNSGDDSGDDN